VRFREVEIKELPASLPFPLEDGAVSLFNGKDLTGWTVPRGAADVWGVNEDNHLVGGGAAGHLLSRRGVYRNFHLFVEARINDGGSGGLLFRARPAPGLPQGYAARINSTDTDRHRTGSLFRGAAPLVPVLRNPAPPGAWFTQEVIALDRHVVVKVNGAVVVDTWLDRGEAPAEGHLALQVLTPATTVAFRQVVVKELPARVRLFPVLKKGRHGPWSVQGDLLLVDHHGGRPETCPNLYFGYRKWKDYDFSVEVNRLARATHCGLWFRAAALGNAHCYCFGKQGQWVTLEQLVRWGWVPAPRLSRRLPLLENNRWYTLRVSVRGGRIRCFLDGTMTFEATWKRHPGGCVGLHVNGSRFAFRNLKVTGPKGKVLLEGLPILDPRQTP
jgi:hypothetical protein